MIDASEIDDLAWRVIFIGTDRGEKYPRELWRHTFKTKEDMPLKTREAIAVLSMYDDGAMVDGIGHRVSERTYWIYDEPSIIAEYESVWVTN